MSPTLSGLLYEMFFQARCIGRRCSIWTGAASHDDAAGQKSVLFLTNMRLHSMVFRRFASSEQAPHLSELRHRGGVHGVQAMFRPGCGTAPRIQEGIRYSSRATFTFGTTFGCMHIWRPGALVTFESRHRTICTSTRNVIHGLRLFFFRHPTAHTRSTWSRP